MAKEFLFWLRWLISIPVGLGFGMLMTFPLHWLILLNVKDHIGEGDYQFISGPGTRAMYEIILTPFVIGFFFVAVSSLLVPKANLIFAKIIGSLWLLFSIGSVIVAIAFPNLFGVEVYIQYYGCPILAGNLGVFAAYHFTKAQLGTIL